MSTDRELLELAAKAAGIKGNYCECASMGSFSDGSGAFHNVGILREGSMPIESMWNPLEDDGDALRLAVALDLMIDNSTAEGWCDIIGPGNRVKECHEDHDDAFTATRRAIVRAAAEIGRAR